MSRLGGVGGVKDPEDSDSVSLRDDDDAQDFDRKITALAGLSDA